jgi:P-type Cu+ transporter
MNERSCYHCGDEVIGKPIVKDEHEFCCNGCSSVYSLLKDNDLGSFYTLEKGGGVRPTESNTHKYAFLDVESIRNKIIEFEDDKTARVNLYIPAIHCSSCIYLLEHSPKIEPAIYSCQVNFAKREASIVFDKNIPLSQLAHFLDKIGYAPNFGNRGKEDKKLDKKFMYKLGIAGFAFGSIMLWSFPEYLGVEHDNPEFRSFTAYLSFAVSIPVLFYSASEYFISAYKAIRHRSLNLDVPITIGIIALYAQSATTILMGDGPGYMDSFAGFIFFLLIGKWFQNKTYKMLSFERDYTSYFPLAVTRITAQDMEEIIEIEELKEGDDILLRNEEVLPCDAELISNDARIDYSFVTGESAIIHRQKGDFIYAGGKLVGQRVKLKVLKETNRSQLTRMWNEVKHEKSEHKGFMYQNKLSYYFLIGLLIVAGGAALGWYFYDPSQIVRIVVAILIVACPCALALSAPFTFGNTMRVLGRNGLYLKNTGVIERLNEVTDIVFDKTGTLTSGSENKIEYFGDELTDEQLAILSSLAGSSTHPLSRAIVFFLNQKGIRGNVDILNFSEIQGKGIQGNANERSIQLGSASFCNLAAIDKNETATYVKVDGKTGRFVFSSSLRSGIDTMIPMLKNYKLHILSGDKDKDRELLTLFFPKNSTILFERSPKDKLDYIVQLKENGSKVLMIGDGLNDSGALGKADVGIAVSEDIFRFSPASDAIIEASQLNRLPQLIAVSKFSNTVLKVCLIFSLSYNVVGLSFAISGNLSPLIAAILMPISSITVVLLSTFLIQFKRIR